MNLKIQNVSGREIIDSRGNPTLAGKKLFFCRKKILNLKIDCGNYYLKWTGYSCIIE